MYNYYIFSLVQCTCTCTCRFINVCATLTSPYGTVKYSMLEVYLSHTWLNFKYTSSVLRQVRLRQDCLKYTWGILGSSTLGQVRRKYTTNLLSQVRTSPSILQVYFKLSWRSKQFSYLFEVHFKYTWRSTASASRARDDFQPYLAKYVLRQVFSKYTSSSLP